eukprot:Gb_24743 [translate_table: standard]
MAQSTAIEGTFFMPHVTASFTNNDKACSVAADYSYQTAQSLEATLALALKGDRGLGFCMPGTRLVDSGSKYDLHLNSNLRFSDKACTLQFSGKLRLKRTSKVWKLVQQVSTESKVAVAPLDLEDAKDPLLNLYRPKEPYTATIVSVESLVGPKAPGKTYHIVINHGGNVPYWEGQSYGVIPPMSPSGKVMLLPEDDLNATHIMVATGTGIAPYRGYLRILFMEDIPSFKFKGLAWLFLGVANTDSLMYHDEFTEYKKKYPYNFRYDTALSREHKNKRRGKMYAQDKIEEYSDQIF